VSGLRLDFASGACPLGSCERQRRSERDNVPQHSIPTRKHGPPLSKSRRHAACAWPKEQRQLQTERRSWGGSAHADCSNISTDPVPSQKQSYYARHREAGSRLSDDETERKKETTARDGSRGETKPGVKTVSHVCGRSALVFGVSTASPFFPPRVCSLSWAVDL
jgi:hypothetical protein